MKKYWFCSASPAYHAQVQTLKRSVAAHTDYEFIHFDPLIYPGATPPELKVSRQRLEETLRLLNEGADEVVVSGADYLVCSALEELNAYTGSALFCPHTFELYTNTPNRQNINLTHAGLINSDFQVWRNTERVKKFLKLVIEELYGPEERRRDVFDFEQLWLPYALSCCDGQLIRHHGYGVAYYNLHDRSVIEHRQVYRQGEIMPLRTFHFSGIDLNNFGALTKYPHQFVREFTYQEIELIAAYRKECAG